MEMKKEKMRLSMNSHVVCGIDQILELKDENNSKKIKYGFGKI